MDHQSLKADLHYDPTIPLLGTYLKECRSTHKTDVCTPMFVTALFTIAKIWNQPGCLTIDKWIKKMWCIYTQCRIIQSQRVKLCHFAGKWMELEIIMLSGISQAQKDKYGMLSLKCGI
jgi:hypothetical protein